MALEVVLGLGIVCFLILYIGFNVGKEHFLLKLFLIIAALSLMLLIPKATLENNNYCEILKINETVSGNLTTYGHDYQCFTNTSTTNTTFYKAFALLIVIFVVYIMVYFYKESLEFLWRLLKK